MKAVPIPGAVPVALPQCQAVVLVPQAQRGRNRDIGAACPNRAKFTLNGKKLCVRHAQAEALKLLTSD